MDAYKSNKEALVQMVEACKVDCLAEKRKSQALELKIKDLESGELNHSRFVNVNIKAVGCVFSLLLVLLTAVILGAAFLFVVRLFDEEEVTVVVVSLFSLSLFSAGWAVHRELLKRDIITK